MNEREGSQYVCDNNITEIDCVGIETATRAYSSCYCDYWRTLYPLLSDELQASLEYTLDYFNSFANFGEEYLGCDWRITCDLKDNDTLISTSTTSTTSTLSDTTSDIE